MEKYFGGVEEAGRGPVIGPMVMTICIGTLSQIERLKNVGVKDSKLLTPLQRERIAESIKEICLYETIILQPWEIDQALIDPDMNLNKLEAVTTMNLIRLIKQKQPELLQETEDIILDCPSNNPEAYKKYVYDLLKKQNINVNIKAEHKADLNHVIVGAASIIAKTTRDKEIETIKKRIGIDFGSGYPADPKTNSFLRQYHSEKKYQDIFRKTWATYKNINKKQTKLGEY